MYADPGTTARSLLRPARALAGLALLALGGGCGEAPEGPSLDVRFAERALLVDAVSLEIRFYRRGSECASLRDTRPRPEPLLGPFRLNLDEGERRAGTVFETEAIPAGVYAVLVDAIDVSGGSAGAGCAPAGEVRDRETSIITVTITE